LNGESAWLAGLELGWQQRLAQLPGAWSGLGIYANYTYTWSRATAEEEGETEEEEEGFQLPGQSPHSGNLAIWYDYKRWSGRAALNVQGDFLLQAAEPEDAALQLIYGGSAQLDLNLGYRINRYWQLFAEGMNLLNTPLRYFTGDKNHPSKLERYGAWGRIGVKVKV
jgi:TonB-dependent receptor